MGRLRAAGVAGQAQRRFLDLHEYQSKGLMASYKVRVQRGHVASSAEEALKRAQELKDTDAKDLILKAQILAGGRGKGHFDTGFKGGVKICSQPEEVEKYAKEMLGNHLITKQTGPEGQLCSKVLVHEGVDFDRELYVAILMDRAHGGPVIVVSPKGGMDIEEVAEKEPEYVHAVPVDIEKGITDAETRRVAELLGLAEEEHIADCMTQVKNLYSLFIGCDATQVEINPLVLTKKGKVYCVDAKINFDDNAAFRQAELFSMRDTSMEDPREVAASEHHLNYIGLDGSIGCMVNGAGLAMATMDIIKLHGGSPANFLDVGGSADADQIAEAFRILTKDDRVKAILVNVFGGIMRCDTIATGIIEAAKRVTMDVPLVVRLAGTNAELGSEMLRTSGLNIETAVDLDDAAIKAVKSIA